MNRRAWLLFSALGLVWGAPYLLIRVAVAEVDPWVVAFARTLIGSLLLLPLVDRRSVAAAARAWPWLLAFSAVEIIGPWVLLGHAETHLPSSTTGLLVAVTPLVAIVMVAGMGLERLDRWRTAGLLVGLVGVAGLVGLDVELGDIPAVLAVVLSATGYAIGPIIVQRKLSDVPPVTVIVGALIVATLAYAPMAVGRWPASWSTESAWSVALLGVICTAVAFLLFFALIAEAGAARATVITYVNPAVAIALGAAVLDERLSIGMLLAFPLILLGSVLATRRVRPPAPVTETVGRAPASVSGAP